MQEKTFRLENKSKSDQALEEILAGLATEANPKETHLIEASFYPLPRIKISEGDKLPYSELGGYGFERLCYQLLMSDGKVPHYFAKPGQKQYGIDILVTDRNGITVYQCKNEVDFSISKIRTALQHFETDWLSRKELPRPSQFVLCCSASFVDLKKSKAWLWLENDFQNRTGIRVILWDRDYIDNRLKYLPDIVSDLFTDLSTRKYCDVGNQWHHDIFRPLIIGSGEKIVDRYLELSKSRRKYLDSKLVDDFSHRIESNRFLLIKGSPGSGKTTTGLALCESMHYSHQSYRIFYTRLRHDYREDDLVKGVETRLSAPTIFFFDDCQGKFDLLENVQNRLNQTLTAMGGKCVVVFTASAVATPEDEPRGDTSYFEEFLAKNDAILEFQTTPELFGKILDTNSDAPQFHGLSTKRLVKLYEFTGHDLFLLDELIQVLKSADEIDELKPSGLYEKTLIRYFGSASVNSRGLMHLAALAQFGLAPTVATFDPYINRDSKEAANQLLGKAGRPQRYYFLHTSAAELIFRSLAWSEGINANYEEIIAQILIQFFNSQTTYDKQLSVSLSDVLSTKLNLRSSNSENRNVKLLFLSNSGILALISRIFENLPLNVVAHCLIILEGNATVYEDYRNLIEQKIIGGEVIYSLIRESIQDTHRFINLIKSRYPIWFSKLRDQMADRFLGILDSRVTLREAVSVISSLSQPRDTQFKDALKIIPDYVFETLIDRTIDPASSISTFYLALRKLKISNSELLEELEHRIGIGRFIRLITCRCTILDLVNIIHYSSPGIQSELIEELNDGMLGTLIQRSIDSGESIIPLLLVLRELKHINLPLLEKLERKIGANRYTRLITSRYSISDWFGIIKLSSRAMQHELISALDNDQINNLIQRTIESNHTIRTIHLTLWELKRTELSLLKELERKIGVNGYTRLIAGLYSILDLFHLIQYSSPDMQRELIGTLNHGVINNLIQRTIDSDRSIDTIHLALRVLKQTDVDLLTVLENKIGVERWWQILCAKGTLQNLAMIVHYSSKSFKHDLSESASSLSVEDWNAILSRGDFHDFSNFVRRTAFLFSSSFSPTLLESLEFTIAELIRKESKLALVRCKDLLIAANNKVIKPHALSLLSKYATPSLISTLAWDTFDEAVNYVFLWWNPISQREYPSLEVLLTKFPTKAIWVRSEQFIDSMRRLLFITSVSQVPQAIARDILSIGNGHAAAPLLEKAGIVHACFYLWNLFSLWFEWGGQDRSAFTNYLLPEICEACIRMLVSRFQSKVNQEEHDSLLSFIGLAYLCGLEFNTILRQEWVTQWSPFKELLRRTSKMTFVPATLYLYGLEWAFDESVPSYKWREVLAMVDLYDVQNSATKDLAQLVRIRGCSG